MSSTSAKRAHPKYSEMVAAALRALKERNGSSRQAILRFIVASFQVGDERTAGVHLKQALRRGVASGSLQQTKGTGASGSFKLSKEKVTKNEKTRGKVTAKKPSAKTATKKASAKTATKKPSAKTATKKPSAKTATKKPSAKTATKKLGAKSTPKNRATKKPTTKTATAKKQTVMKTA
ncbi:histone H1-delta-like [Penaeus monodon]|uniref:histone H1-delta-like n=1 Tax=Penaeus monodon TaxID=6687 RepID=UPI0018A73CB7|nr:histone H1-delta-like [Penaeus monodon]